MAGVAGPLRRLLSDLARTDAPQLLEEARAAARARARKILEDALVDELLKAAPGLPGQASADAPTETGQAWWVYGVVSDEHAGDLAGLAGIEPGTAVAAVAEGQLAALVSEVPLAEYGDDQLRAHLEDIAWLEHTARAHESVQEQVMGRAPLVPLRLCTIYRDLDAVRRALRENAEVFSAALAELQDCAEWGVKVFRELTAGPPPSAAEAEAEGRSGIGYLAQRQRERELASQADELCTRCAEEVHHAVAALARQERVNPVQRPEAHGRQAEMILNAAYLLEHDRVEELQGLIAQLQKEWAPVGLLVEGTGPWPPYNFVADLTGMVS